MWWLMRASLAIGSSSPVNADHPRVPAGTSAIFTTGRVRNVVQHGTSVRHPISDTWR
jgi:hypothetical protein